MTKTLGVMLGMYVGMLAVIPSALASDLVVLGTPQPVGGGISLGSIACETADTCLAIGNSTAVENGQTVTSSEVVPISDGVPGAPVAVPGPAGSTTGYSVDLTDLVCASSSTCYAVGSYLTGPGGPAGGSGGAIVTIVNGVPSQPQIITASTPEGYGPTNQLALTGISCWSANGCEVVGNLTMAEGGDGLPSSDGVAASLLNGVPQSVNAGTINAANIGIYLFNSIECFGAGTCEIVGMDANNDNAFLVGINGSTFTPPQSDAGMWGDGGMFACYSTSSCLILSPDEDTYQTLTDNATIGPNASPGPAYAVGGGSCPTTTVCWIVGVANPFKDQTLAEPIINGVAEPTTLTSYVGELLGVACSSATTCMAITSSAIVSITDTGTSASAPGSGGGSGSNPGGGTSTAPGAGSTSSTSSGASSGSSAGPSTVSNAAPQIVVANPTQKDGLLKVAIDCKDAKCILKLTETFKVKQGQRTKLQTVASKTVTLAAGRSAVESLKLNGQGAKTLKRARGERLRTTLTISMSGKRVSVKTLMLIADPPKKS